MQVMNLDKFDLPDRLNFGQSRVVFYPAKAVTKGKDGVVTSCVTDPENCGYVVLSSHADCTSKEQAKSIKMTYRDFARLLATVTKSEDLKNKILKRAENEAVLEIERMNAMNHSKATMLSAGKDLGLTEEDVLLIIKSD